MVNVLSIDGNRETPSEPFTSNLHQIFAKKKAEHVLRFVS